MNRLSLQVGSLAGLLLFLPGISANTQQGKNVSYWPFKKGSTWTLTTHVSGHDFDQVVTVTDVTPGKNYSTATLDYTTNGKSTQVEKYQFNRAGIARAASGLEASNPISPPITVVKYPLKSGDSWKWKGTITQGSNVTSGVGTLAVSGPETIKTPAGTFKAMKVHLILTISVQNQQFTIPNDYWFAPNVGLVKQSAVLNSVLIEGELKSYKL